MPSQNSNLIVEIFQKLLQKNNTNAYRISKEQDIDKAYLSKLFSGAIAKPGKNKLAVIAKALNIELEPLQLVFSNPEIAIQELSLENIELDLNLSPNIRSKHDWGAAPDGIVCYGRKSEMIDLQRLIKINCCRVLTIFGMGGIGKTTLAMEIARQLETEFDHILWRTLTHISLVEVVIQDALRLFGNKKPEATISQQIANLLQYLRDRRCLLILDQVETILSTGNALDIYQNGYEFYGELFKQIAETNHQSCLVLVSNEKPKDISILEGDSASIYSWQLKGSTAVCYKILQYKEMIPSPAWDELIAAYREHPLAIKIVGSMIKELFDGNVSEFLRLNTLFLGDLEFILHEQYYRLSDSEKYIVNIIAQMNKPLSLQELSEQYATKLRASEIMNSLNNLKRRSLIEIIVGDKSWQKSFVPLSQEVQINKINFYTIQPVVRKYITSQT
ncbi:MAG: NB-ARC domain-containing protein [Pleurocapsa sp.]